MQDVVLVTRSVSVRDFVERSLRSAGMRVQHAVSAAHGAGLAKAAGTVCLCTPEIDWRSLVTEFASGPVPGPPVVVLLSSADHSVWARVLRGGAFDAVRISEGSEALLRAVEYALANWTRRQSVREAVYVRTAHA
jgi:DNA-binding NtrC family response regulator